MKAKVRDDAPWKVIQACAGERFFKDAWTPVPAGREQEAANNPYLEVTEDMPAQSGKVAEPEEKKSSEVIVDFGDGLLAGGAFAKPTELDATPAAVALAEKHGLDLSTITTISGRITKADVDKLIKGGA